MKKLILFYILIILFSCKKESVIEPVSKPKSQPLTIETNIDRTILFTSLLDDSINYKSNSINQFGYLYYDTTIDFKIFISDIDTSNIQLGLYTNQHLVSNADFGIKLVHDVYLADGTIAGITIGSSNTQIIELEITKIENNRVWIVFNIEWNYSHWQYPERNKSGTIVGNLNGFKFK